ncbi:partner of Y14 and mago-like [Melia azedarach]|uniref:Partner of Y14 and mago-like n=1 Tax=Melia azedarach TaxID=155640 RepID=A0ACC1XZQ7_MELAZ|nr:partner of Y14 and mago-like [Melia azedarach]
MATSNGGGGGEDELNKMAEISKTLKEGERIVAPTRRPDGTLRKPIRIRAGYVPQEEVAIYQSKGALLRKELMALQEVPPGYDPAVDAKPKSKSVKRNERKKEKRLQASLEKGKNVETMGDEETKREEVLPAENVGHGSASAKLLMSQMNELSVSSNSVAETPVSDANDANNSGAPGQDIDKRIRALKKKIRLAEAQQQKTGQQELKQEQSEKLSKVVGWREELKLLEDKKAELAAS